MYSKSTLIRWNMGFLVQLYRSKECIKSKLVVWAQVLGSVWLWIHLLLKQKYKIISRLDNTIDYCVKVRRLEEKPRD